MATYEYLRVSTNRQDALNQQSGIRAYAEQKKLEIDETIEDIASGKISWRMRSLGPLIDRLLPCDIIIVSEISRLARSTLQVLEILQHAAQRELVVHIAKSGLIVDGTMQSKIITTILGLAAEIEREFISARTTEALARRKAAGLPMGRPAGESQRLMLDEISGNIDSWKHKGLSWVSMAKLAECSRSTLYAWARRRRPEWLESPAD